MIPHDNILNESMFDVEHALSLYATSFLYFPAKLLYDKECLKQYEDVSEYRVEAINS
jgi:hypothetical protein